VFKMIVYLFSSYKLLASFEVSIVLMLQGLVLCDVTLCSRGDSFQINVVPSSSGVRLLGRINFLQV